MIVRPLGLDSVMEVVPQRFSDARGFFSETYNLAAFAEAGIRETFVQDNHSWSATRGIMRGLHYQLPPFAQAKLVRVMSGAVFDVAVDIRRDSPHFGRWVGLELSAEAGNQIFVPAGFAHGFVTLTDDVHLLYKVSAPYSAAHDRSIRFDDPDIAVDWPVLPVEAFLSEKDRKAPLLGAAETF